MKSRRPLATRYARRRATATGLVFWSLVTLVCASVVLWPSLRILMVDRAARLRTAVLESLPPTVFRLWPDLSRGTQPPSLLATYADLVTLEGLLPVSHERWMVVSPETRETAAPNAEDDRQQASTSSMGPMSLVRGQGVSWHPVSGASPDSALRVVRWVQRPAEEVFELAAVPLQPGHSVTWLPASWLTPEPVPSRVDRGLPFKTTHDDKPAAQWDKGPLSLVVYCLGATADRLDAPGSLQIVSDTTSVPTVVNVPVSHVPQIVKVPVAQLLGGATRGLRLTWAPESSGVLVILGVQSTPPGSGSDRESVRDTVGAESRAMQAARVPDSLAGRLFVTTDELLAEGPFLEAWVKRLQDPHGPWNGSLRTERWSPVWPAEMDHEKNTHVFREAWAGGESAQTSVPYARGEHRIDVLPPGVLTSLNASPGLPLLKTSWVQARVRSRSVVLSSESLFSASGSGQGAATGNASLLRAVEILLERGTQLHAHLWSVAGSAEVQPSASYVLSTWKRVLGGSAPLRALRPLSLFASQGDRFETGLRDHAHLYERLIDSLAVPAMKEIKDSAQPIVPEVRVAALASRLRVPGTAGQGTSASGVLSVVAGVPDAPGEFLPGAALLVARSPSAPAAGSKADSRSSGADAEGTQESASNKALGPALAQQDFVVALRRLWTEGVKDGKAVASSDTLLPLPSVPQDSTGLRQVAEVRGRTGTLHVFNRGWAFVPGAFVEPLEEGSRQTRLGAPPGVPAAVREPEFGLPLGDVAAARKVLFDRAVTSRRAELHIVLPLDVDLASVSIDIRSEFPMWRCTSPAPGATFESSFGYDGTMTVTAKLGSSSDQQRSKASVSRARLSCVVDVSHPNPMLRSKPPSAAEGRSANAAAAKKPPSRPVSFSVRLSAGGSRVPISKIVLGPYGESAALFGGAEGLPQRAQVALDLKADWRRLVALWRGDVADLAQDSFVLWLSPQGEPDDESLRPTDIKSTEWETQVRDFLERRDRMAEKARKAPL